MVAMFLHHYADCFGEKPTAADYTIILIYYRFQRLAANYVYYIIEGLVINQPHVVYCMI